MNEALDFVDAAVIVLERAAPGDPGAIGGQSGRLPALRLTHANRCALELLGAPDRDALCAQIHQVFLPEALGELEQAWRELSNGAERAQLFCEISSLSGSRLAVKLTAAKADDGGLVVTAFDSTPASATVRRQTEALLAESEARFRTMADCAPVLLWQAGTDTGCEFFNEFWLNFTGRRVEEELGSGWAAGVHPEDFQKCMSTFLSAFVERRQFRMEYRLRRHDGQYRWLLDHGVPRFAPDGSFAGYIGSCIDITELKDVYSALTTRLRERDMLLREVHHRVKNNLQLVSSLLSMQARSLSDSLTREALNDSRKRVQSIALIHDELYQAQDFTHVAFAEYIRRLCTLVVQATSPSVERVSLKLDLESVALGIDRAIPCGLILNELLINSVKHGFADGRSGAIHVELREPESNRIELTVADNGVGLPPGLDVRQAQTVGMQIVCTLAEQLEAELDVQQRGGTTFKLGFSGVN